MVVVGSLEVIVGKGDVSQTNPAVEVVLSGTDDVVDGVVVVVKSGGCEAVVPSVDFPS